MNRILTIFLLSLLAPMAYAQIDQGKILDYVNDLRANGCQCGNYLSRTVSGVQWSKELANVAQDYADELAEVNAQMGNSSGAGYMSHIGTDGSTLESRLNDHEVYLKYSIENLACLQGNENMVIDYWLNNPETCKNIMAKEAVMIGVARNGRFWVMILGKK